MKYRIETPYGPMEVDNSELGWTLQQQLQPTLEQGQKLVVTRTGEAGEEDAVLLTVEEER